MTFSRQNLFSKDIIFPEWRESQILMKSGVTRPEGYSGMVSFVG